jgi:photosystem II stability/assembly factor-like uncharacterized protein
MKYIFLLCVLIFPTQSFTQWRTIETIISPFVFAMHFDNDNVYIGTGDSLYISRDKGETWYGTNFLTDSPYTINALTEYEGVLYAGSYVEGVFRSSDNGDTWESFNQGLSGWGLISNGFLISGDTLILITDGGGVYMRNLNSTESWFAVNNNLPDNYAWTVHDICQTSTTLIIGSGASGYYYLLLKGTSEWQERRIKYGDRSYPTPSALISYNDVVLAGTRLGIFRSTDHGETWDSVGIRALPLGTVSFARDGNRIYAGLTNASDFWVWYTDDLGDSWNVLDHQFANLNEIYVYDNKIWAATNSGLMVSNPLPTTNVPGEKPIPVNFSLEQNYPNPFNPATTISYSLPGEESLQVNLKIYDMIGNEITALVNEEKQPGNYKVNFNASGLSSGVYFYTLNISGKENNYSSSKKMIVLK